MAAKILLLDIETAPHQVYVWGLFNQNVSIDKIIESGYTLCWSAKWLDSKEIMFDSIQQSSMENMLIGVHQLLSEADIVIHYNGSRFDIPTLNREFVLYGLDEPSPFKQIDLLDTIRNRFKFPSNKLDYVAKALGYQGKVAHKGMELWKECMAGNIISWDTMRLYNKQDVRILEDVYIRIRPWINNHPNVALYSDKEETLCPKCGSKHLHYRGYATTLAGIFHKFKCSSCGGWGRRAVNLIDKNKRKGLARNV